MSMSGKKASKKKHPAANGKSFAQKSSDRAASPQKYEKPPVTARAIEEQGEFRVASIKG